MLLNLLGFSGLMHCTLFSYRLSLSTRTFEFEYLLPTLPEPAEPRLVVVSNTVPIPKWDGSLPAGGLTSGMEDAVKSRRTLWFGTSGKVNETNYEHELPRGNIDLVFLDMTANEYFNYYEGFSNTYLWPMFHSLFDKMDYKPEFWDAYNEVNDLLASRLAPRVTDGDLIWVQDYHLLPFGAKLRSSHAAKCESLGQDCAPLRLGFFLHIPFPEYHKVFSQMSCGSDGPSCEVLQNLFKNLCAYDLIGVQTDTDAENLNRALIEVGVKAMPRIEVHPIGINPEEYNVHANEGRETALLWLTSQFPELNLNGKQLIISVDRLDYTKGIPERFHGLELMLRQHPEMRDQVEFLQIAAPSRPGVPMYQALKKEVNAVVHTMALEWRGRSIVNFYAADSVNRPIIAALCRLAQVGMVTPLADGMNLFAKEFVAAHGNPSGSLSDESEIPGVLLLSMGAGARHELAEPGGGPGAIMVDAYNTQSIADGLYEALTMSPPQRRERWKRMSNAVHKITAGSWGTRFLYSLNKGIAA